MRKLTIAISAMALSAATLSFPFTASAQPGPDREPPTRAEVESRADEMFAKLDVNGDGVLTKDDREAKFAERFAEADTDGNGQLSQEEAAAAHENRRDAAKERLAERKSERGERKGREGKHRMGHRGGPGGPGGPGPGMMLRQADANEDGQITNAEFKAAALARFDRADTDGDGTISDDERKGAREGRRHWRDRSAS